MYKRKILHFTVQYYSIFTDMITHSYKYPHTFKIYVIYTCEQKEERSRSFAHNGIIQLADDICCSGTYSLVKKLPDNEKGNIKNKHSQENYNHQELNQRHAGNTRIRELTYSTWEKNMQ